MSQALKFTTLLLPGLRLVNSRNFSSSPSVLRVVSNKLISSPTERNKLISSPLYNFLPDTQNPNNIVALVCSSLKQNDSVYWDHLKHQGLFSHFTSFELSRVLLRCQSDSATAFTFFEWVQKHLSLKPSAYNYSIMIHSLVWSKRFKQAMKLLSELIETNDDENVSLNLNAFKTLLSCSNECNCDPVVFDMLIKAYLKKDMVRESYRAFRKMLKLGFVPSLITINCLVNGLSRVDGGEKCWLVFEEMQRIGVHPNACTFNILTHIVRREGNVEKVNSFLERMEEQGFEHDVVTYNMVIDSYCKMGRLKDAVYLYNIMYMRNITPDLITFTTLINGLCKGGNVREAHQLFHLMVNRRLIPDAISYNTLVHGYCKEGKMKEARSLLFYMIENGAFPDNFTCWTVIKGYQSQGSLISALNLILDLIRRGIHISSDVYIYMILALCRDNRPFAAKSLLDRMCQNDSVPFEKVSSELVGSFCRCNFVNEALELKLEMVSMGVKLNLSVYKALIKGLCGLSRTVEAQSLMQDMAESGLPLDVEICRTLMNGFCNEKNLSEAERLLELFSLEYQIFDSECYNVLVKVLAIEESPAKFPEFQERMVKLGFEPNGVTCKYVINGMCKAIKQHAQGI